MLARGIAGTLILLFPATALGAEAGDAARGERVFQRCYSCHSVDPNEAAKLQGPSLYRIMNWLTKLSRSRKGGLRALLPFFLIALEKNDPRGDQANRRDQQQKADRLGHAFYFLTEYVGKSSEQ
jgi:hypothetical protein